MPLSLELDLGTPSPPLCSLMGSPGSENKQTKASAPGFGYLYPSLPALLGVIKKYHPYPISNSGEKGRATEELSPKSG